MTDLIARRERFAVAGSTNDVVREWLADGTPEVCLAIADEQTAGRGRDGRTWTAPRGAAVLLSLGFRPTWLPIDRTWRLAACVSLAMADSAEAVAGMPAGTIRLKWPNDLVIESTSGIRKLGGVLGESDGLGTADPRVVIGIGVNGDWPSATFPAGLAEAMTSLRVMAADRPIDHDQLIEDFIGRLAGAVEALRDGQFDVAAWAVRQLTTGRDVELTAPDGGIATLRALDVDPASGALVVADAAAPDGRRAVVVGEIRHVRLAAAETAGV
jgi:BirA family biotin operon repressor/biotin-[acetyl-CoA-carboxylase] ligase